MLYRSGRVTSFKRGESCLYDNLIASPSDRPSLDVGPGTAPVFVLARGSPWREPVACSKRGRFPSGCRQGWFCRPVAIGPSEAPAPTSRTAGRRRISRLRFADGTPTCRKSRDGHRPRSCVPLLPPVRPPGSRPPPRARGLVSRGCFRARCRGGATRSCTAGCSGGPSRHLAGADASCRPDRRGPWRVTVPRGQRSCAVHRGGRLALEPSVSVAKVDRPLRADQTHPSRARSQATHQQPARLAVWCAADLRHISSRTRSSSAPAVSSV